MISTANITMQFGEKPLFENISVKFQGGNRYGLIGANGCGKSTLMKILTGDLKPSQGSVTVGDGQRLGVLSQDQFAFEEYRVVDAVIMGHKELWKIKAERERIYGLPEMSEEDGIKVAELEMEFAEMDGYSAESSASELLQGLDIPLDQHYGLMSEIAPGWKLRVLLAQALFSDPEVLLLDEPTNNLDINSIRWLEGVLSTRKSTMVIISHDRHFLNGVCTHMADLDYGALNVFPGNYDDFMIAATAIQERMRSENAKKEVKIKDLKHFVSRFSANASKAKQATSRAKQIEKIKIEDMKPSSRQYPFIRFEYEEKDKLYRQALTINKLSHAYEKPLFDNVNFMVEAGEKVAIIGENGIGKSTLLKILANTVSPDEGSVKWAEKAKISYFAQDHNDEFDKGTSIFDWINHFKQVQDDDQSIKGILGRLLFSGDDFKKKVNVLSGGEQGRMLFGKIMLERNNILLLDEPTNHMDMESIESLNTALDKYKGTVFFVTHDREFVSSVATRIFEIKSDKIIDYTGNYEDYIATQELD